VKRVNVTPGSSKTFLSKGKETIRVMGLVSGHFKGWEGCEGGRKDYYPPNTAGSYAAHWFVY